MFSLFVFNIFSKYVGVVPLKDKKGITITQAFPENDVTQMNEVTNQAKYEQIKAVSFTIDQ